MRVEAGSQTGSKLFDVFETFLWSRFIRSLLLSCSMSTSAAPVHSGEHTRHSPDPLLAPQGRSRSRRQPINQGPLTSSHETFTTGAHATSPTLTKRATCPSHQAHTRATKHRTLRPPLRPRSKTAPPRVIPPGKSSDTWPPQRVPICYVSTLQCRDAGVGAWTRCGVFV